MKTSWKNREILGAKNRENVWEQFTDLFGEQIVLSFSNLGNSRFPNLEKYVVSNLGKVAGIFRPRESRIGSLVR